MAAITSVARLRGPVMISFSLFRMTGALTLAPGSAATLRGLLRD